MSIKPWLKWYPSDWRSEPRLRIVTRAARSFWLDLIGLMHEAQPYGHLIVAGRSPSPKELGAVLGDPERDVTRYLAELDGAGIYSTSEDGTIYSRRMVRDFSKAETDKANGKGGGNPQLIGGVIPLDNADDKAQKLEARIPKPESTPKPPKGADTDFEQFWKSYPRTPNMSKAAALKAWTKQKHHLPPIADLLAAVAKYKSFLQSETKKQNGREYPACHAQRWLNEQRWSGFENQSPIATMNHSPDWADAIPEWAAFKAKASAPQWAAWLKPARPNGSLTSLIVASKFDAGKIQEIFGPAMEDHFGEPVTFNVEGK